MMFLCVFLNMLHVCRMQKPKRVKAMYNCVADNPDELTFSEGEIIVVDGEEDQEWWVSIFRSDEYMQLEIRLAGRRGICHSMEFFKVLDY